jgi:outer membrane cobalamin receptor
MKFVAHILLLVMLLPSELFCQSGIIQGRLTDQESREYLAGALIQLNEGKYQTFTNAVGAFHFNDIQPGRYRIHIEYLGYETFKDSFDLNRGEERVLQYELRAVPIELESIAITAAPEVQNDIISSIDISLRNVNSSQDVLRLVPGLFIAQHAGGGKAEQIFLRGFDIDHGTDIAITTDGMPVNMVSHAHGQGYADLHYLIPETVDRVHFGKGPYHTHYGNLATAGYVGFQTLNHLQENKILFQAGQFSSFRGLGMFNLYKPVEQQKRNAYITAEYLSTDGYFDSPQNFRRLCLFGKYNSELGNHHFLSGSVSTFGSRWDASGQIPLRSVEDGSISFFGSIDDTEGGETSRTNANLQLSSMIHSNSFIKNQVFYTHYDFELYSNFTFFLKDSIHGDQIRQRESRNLIGYNGVYTRTDQLNSISLQTEFGVQYRKDFSNDNELSHTANKTMILQRLAYGDIQEGNVGIYLNETFTFFSTVTVNAGLRYDHFTFAYKDHLVSDTRSVVSDNIFSPKLNTYVKLSDKLQVFGNIGYGFHSNDTRVVIQQNGAETLPRALGIDIGCIWKPAPTLLLSGTIWHLDLDQEFVYVGDEAIVEPSGETRRKGIEFSGRWEILDWLYADLDVNLTDAYALHEPEGHNNIPLAPRFSSIGGLTIQTHDQWNGSVRYRHLGNRPANEDYSVIAEGYTVVDLLLSKRIKKYEVGFSIENVFDVRWREAQFDTESRLKDEVEPVSEIHFTAGTPFQFKAHVAYMF